MYVIDTNKTAFTTFFGFLSDFFYSSIVLLFFYLVSKFSTS